MASITDLRWYRIADLDELPEGRVKTVAAGTRSLALTHVDGEYAALDNHCPHQGGPLGRGLDRGRPAALPVARLRLLPVERRLAGRVRRLGADASRSRCASDGIYVGLDVEAPHVRTVSDVMAETLANWGVRHVFGMVGHSNLGLADAIRRQVEAGRLEYIGIRHEGAAAFAASAYAKLTGTPAACLTIAGPGATNLLTGLWDAQGRPRAGARAHRPGGHERPRRAQLPGGRPARRVRLGRGVQPDGAAEQPARRADRAGGQARDAHARRVASRLPRRGADDPGRRGRAGRDARRPDRRRPDPPARRGAGPGPRADRRVVAAGDHRRPRRALRHARRDRARRTARRAGHHDVQGQGPDPRRASARLRRARPQRHAGGVVGDERGRPAAGVRRVVQQPHRHLRRPPDHPGRPRPGAARQVPLRRGAAARRRRRHRRRARRRGDAQGRPGVAGRAALGAVAGREGQPPRRRPRPRRQQRGDLRQPHPARPRARRASPSTSATTPTASGATSSASPGRRC